MIINDTIFNVELGDIIDELQNQLNINKILLLGKRKDTPDNIMIACPYHKDGQERKPSMGIHKKTGVCHCFTCGETVALQEMITHCFGHYDDKIGAFGWNWLLKNFLTISVEERRPIELDMSRTPTIQKPAYVSEEELDSYRYFHPYMYKRKLTDEIIEMFDIGYDKNTLCITFPIRDISGNTLFIARRSVQTKFFNYPMNAEKPVYGLYELYHPEAGDLFPSEVIICESMIDALTCWVYGKPAVALNGLGNDLQFKQLNQMPCRKFILATDMDNAGREARKRIRANIKNKIVTEYLWDVNVAKDINDMDKEMFTNLEEVF